MITRIRDGSVIKISVKRRLNTNMFNTLRFRCRLANDVFLSALNFFSENIYGAF